MTNQRLVYGSTNEWSTDGSTWSVIPETKTLAVPSVEIEYPEVTSLDSPDGFREFIPGLKDAGEITINAGYSTLLYADATAYEIQGTLLHFRTTLTPQVDQSSGDQFEFRAYVRPVMQQNAVGEPIGLDLVLRISGRRFFTAGALA